MPRPPNPTTKPRVHQGEPRLEAVLDFVAFAARPMPLVTLLDEAPRRIATIFGADVCSLYLLEGEGNELVMRGNVGFPNTALGQVRLDIGEGITGAGGRVPPPVLGRLRGASTPLQALRGARRGALPGVPRRADPRQGGAARRHRRPARSATPFDDADIELLIGARRAHRGGHPSRRAPRRAAREGAAPRRAGGGTRKVTLPGRPLVPGPRARRHRRAAPAVRSAAAESAPTDRRHRRSPAEERRSTSPRRRSAGSASSARRSTSGATRAFLSTYVEILGDMRFRERAMEIGDDRRSAFRRPSAASRARSRAPRRRSRATRSSRSAPATSRTCATRSACSPRPTSAPSSRAKAILVGDALTVFDLLISARAHPVGVALTERASGPRTRALLELLGVPAIVDVQGLFRWASDGDIALLDADHGLS